MLETTMAGGLTVGLSRGGLVFALPDGVETHGFALKAEILNIAAIPKTNNLFMGFFFIFLVYGSKLSSRT